jgi:hypothetical protein
MEQGVDLHLLVSVNSLEAELNSSRNRTLKEEEKTKRNKMLFEDLKAQVGHSCQQRPRLDRRSIERMDTIHASNEKPSTLLKLHPYKPEDC